MAESSLEVGQRVASSFAALPEVTAVALAGSTGAGVADPSSDLDLYVYCEREPSLDARRAIVAGAAHAELDNRFFEPGDEWIDAASGTTIDVMFRAPTWIEDQLDRVLVRHEASTGYSTCLWANVVASSILFDRTGWYAALQDRARVPYPEALRRAVFAKNLPLLATTQSSYAAQLDKAIARGDVVSANHRTAAFLASFFDVLFAANRVPHPGEKRLLDRSLRACPLRPRSLDDDVRELVRAAARLMPDTASRARALAKTLEELVAAS